MKRKLSILKIKIIGEKVWILLFCTKHPRIKVSKVLKAMKRRLFGYQCNNLQSNIPLFLYIVPLRRKKIYNFCESPPRRTILKFCQVVNALNPFSFHQIKQLGSLKLFYSLKTTNLYFYSSPLSLITVYRILICSVSIH